MGYNPPDVRTDRGAQLALFHARDLILDHCTTPGQTPTRTGHREGSFVLTKRPSTTEFTRPGVRATATGPGPTLRHRVVTGAAIFSIAAGLVGSILTGPVAAQDGTGAATPTPPSRCAVVASEVGLATYTPAADPAGNVTPPATTSPATPLPDQVDGTPAGTPEASPVMDQASPATPGADPLQAEITAAANAIVGCLNESNTTTFLNMTTGTYLGQLTGNNGPVNDATYVALVPTFPVVDNRVVTITDFSVIDTATVSARVTYTHAYQQRTSTWTFVQDVVDGQIIWMLDSETPLEADVPGNSTSVNIAISKNRYDLSSSTIDDANVVFTISNKDKVDHEALVLRFADGVTTDSLLAAPGPAFPAGVELIGQATIPAGASGSMVLADLPTGTYTMVCLLPNQEGVPHLSEGMTTTFEIT